MKKKGITEGALKMARKMTDTIFPRHSISPTDRDLLLTLITGLAVDDLVHSQVLEWIQEPPHQCSLVHQQTAIGLSSERKLSLYIQSRYGPRMIEKAGDQVERILDGYHLDEEEKDTLYTALACLGLHALEDYLKWKTDPPFDELG